MTEDEELTPRERAMMEVYEKKIAGLEAAVARGERILKAVGKIKFCQSCWLKVVDETRDLSPSGNGKGGMERVGEPATEVVSSSHSNTAPTLLEGIRLFVLNRKEDVSGVSGTGAVACGIVFPDGSAAMWWKGGESVSVWHRVEDITKIHGHDGRTVLTYLAQ